MKTPQKNLALGVISALVICVASSASAAILQFAGSTVLSPNTPGTADEFSQFRDKDGDLGFLSVVNGSTEIFSTIPVGTDFIANSPLVFSPAASSPDPLFSFRGYSFVISDDTSILFRQGDTPGQFLNVFAQGTILGPNNFEEAAALSITTVGAADRRGRISISGNLQTGEAVPEGGQTVALLGLGLIGLAAIRKQLK